MAKQAPVATPDKTNDQGFSFERSNYKLLLIGIAILIVGYLLMLGGGSDNPNEFNADELFSFRRITLAPIVVIGGYIFIIYAIMRKPSN